MNKKDVAMIRKQLKQNNDLLKITDLYHIYIMKETSDIYYQECQPFSLIEQEQQELLLKNFKKVLTGQLDEKLFEIKFQQEAENHTRDILYQSIQTKDVEVWQEQMLKLVAKILQHQQFEMDVVITFIRGEYCKPTKPKNEETDHNERDEVYAHPFILCSMNKTEQPKKTLLFDYVEKEFKYNVEVDAQINLTSPLAGFFYPCFTNNTSDVNHILFSTGKANALDPSFIEDVLNGESTLTAQENKAVFEEIVKDVVGPNVNATTLANVYEEINKVVEESEEEDVPTLDYKDVGHILKVSGVEDVNIAKVEHAFQKIVDDEKYELKASSIVPKYTSKSIKINTKVATISISPQDLKYVKQVQYNGKRCLVIEVDEDTEIDGFTLIPETF